MSTITITEQAAPSTPSSGRVVLYAKTDGLVYAKNDAGSESALGLPAALTGTSITITGGTVTDTRPVFDATQTWNDAAELFTGIKLNVTNTNSAATSKLVDLQIGGTTQFNVTRGGSGYLSGNILVGTTSVVSAGGVSSANTLLASGASVWVANFVQSNAAPNGLAILYSGAAPNSTAAEFLYCIDSSTARFVVRSNGGLANFSANNANLSDGRVKTDIVPMESFWDEHKSVAWCTYRYKDQTHGDRNFGYIAQNIEYAFAETAPELVDRGFGKDDDLLTVYADDLHNIGHAVLSEAQKRIEVLERQNASLKALLVANGTITQEQADTL